MKKIENNTNLETLTKINIFEIEHGFENGPGHQIDCYSVKSTNKTNKKIDFTNKHGGCVFNINNPRGNILSEILSIEFTKDIDNFFKRNGFWINPGNPNYYYTFEIAPLREQITVLKTIITILNEVNSDNPNYNELLQAYIELCSYDDFFGIKGNIDECVTKDEPNAFSIQPPTDLALVTWANHNAFSILLQDDRLLDLELENKIGTIHDYVTNKDINIEFNRPEEYNRDLDIIPFNIFIKALFSEILIWSSEYALQAASLFYHLIDDYEKNNAPITDSDFDITSLNASFLNEITKQKLKEFSLHLAMYYVKNGLSNMKTEIDEDTAKLQLVIPDLISATFFSIANFNYKKFEFIKCKSEKCHNYFIRNRNAERQRYCCQKCANRETQRTYIQNHPKKKKS